MSILDDAIREHLELKRQHGAPDVELKKLEDEAFGPPARPEEALDPLAEAPTEFLVTPGAVEGTADLLSPDEDVEPAAGRRVPDIADLQEAPPTPAPEPAEAEVAEEEEPSFEPAEEEQPAMEHETIPELPPLPPESEEPAGSHSTEERHVIAEQPTEMFDVESALASPDSPAPSDEELVDAELAEPHLEASPPPVEQDAFEDEEEDFFDEQRLSDELDQALEAPLKPVEVEEEEAEVGVEEEATQQHETVAHGEEHEDVLEDTPDFLEETPEDDQLWFEQKPPKDFDFDD